MITVKVCPYIYSRHFSQIYSGLYDLVELGIINLNIELNPKYHCYSETYSCLLLDVFYGCNKSKTVCFDMHDSCEIKSINILDICDNYFKRSYNSEYLSCFNKVRYDKIKPYGLNYECWSRNENNLLKRLYCFYRHCDHNLEYGSKINHAIREIFKHILLKFNIQLLHLKPIINSDIFVEPFTYAEPSIFFQTRLWSNKDCPELNDTELNQINRMRIDTVKLLKEIFGNRFNGGLIDSEMSRSLSPGLISPLNSRRKYYLDMMKKNLICVTTKGLHNSIGGRFPEYLAASRCVVTEPMMFELPVPLKNGTNYLSFNTPEECVTACHIILDDKKLISEMRKSNFEYFLNNLEPSKLILNCLVSE